MNIINSTFARSNICSIAITQTHNPASWYRDEMCSKRSMSCTSTVDVKPTIIEFVTTETTETASTAHIDSSRQHLAVRTDAGTMSNACVQ